MPAEFMKGALISLMPTVVRAIPNVIVFQFNPESMTHGWTAAPGDAPSRPQSGGDPQAARTVPGETFSFTLSLDATDMIADGSSNPVAAALAQVSGISTRLAAIEMLQFPAADTLVGLVGSVSASAASVVTNGGTPASVPSSQVPTVLFVYGPQRILPVRVTELSTTETLYDKLLNPTHADVHITLRVLTPDELVATDGPMRKIAKVAYIYTQALREVQAAANLGDAAASIIGMLPSPF